jgi:hypothetical protein
MAAIVGREHELAQVETLLTRRNEGVDGLLLEGEAGVGKSTLWLAGVELARERGFRVLSARPAEAERELAYVGLDQPDCPSRAIRRHTSVPIVCSGSSTSE